MHCNAMGMYEKKIMAVNLQYSVHTRPLIFVAVAHIAPLSLHCHLAAVAGQFGTIQQTPLSLWFQ